MKVLFANQDPARIRSIDTTEAETIDGVIAIFTAKRCARKSMNMDWAFGINQFYAVSLSKPYADRVRFVGDQV